MTMKDWNLLKYNKKAVTAHIRNIRWKAFGIVNTFRDSLSDKKLAALLSDSSKLPVRF